MLRISYHPVVGFGAQGCSATSSAMRHRSKDGPLDECSTGTVHFSTSELSGCAATSAINQPPDLVLLVVLSGDELTSLEPL